MQNPSSKSRAYTNLFLPSALSVVFVIFLAVAIIGLHQFSAIKTYLQFPDSINLFRIVAVWLDHLLTSIFGQSRLQVIVVGGFWAVVGLVVYLFLRNLARLVVEFDDEIEVRRFVWPKDVDRTKPLRMMVERTIFRVAAIVGLLLLAFGPLTRLLGGPILVEFLNANVVLEYICWFVTNVLILHLATILLRLIVLKSRIFG